MRCDIKKHPSFPRTKTKTKTSQYRLVLKNLLINFNNFFISGVVKKAKIQLIKIITKKYLNVPDLLYKRSLDVMATFFLGHKTLRWQAFSCHEHRGTLASRITFIYSSLVVLVSDLRIYLVDEYTLFAHFAHKAASPSLF